MKLAFVLFRYFPYGGLERDMLAMAKLCRDRGHEITIYTREWQGERPDLPVVELPVRSLTNHGLNAAFIRRFQQYLAEHGRPDRVVGFNKMPGLDFYYAADVCFAEKVYAGRGPLYRLLPRARSYLAQEKAVFERTAHTHALMISRHQLDLYQRYYQTPDRRMHMLPPGIRRTRLMPADYNQRRPQLRKEYGLADDQSLLLMVGSDFDRKGLDRCIRGIAALPAERWQRICLWVAGQDDPTRHLRLAESLGVQDQLRILGGRDDVSELMWAADALLHPAYSENTGTVLLEGMVAGLPVIASDVCGYAHYIEEWQMGAVLETPVTDTSMAAAIEAVLAAPRQQWIERAQRFAAEADIFSMTERAAELIERLGGPAAEPLP